MKISYALCLIFLFFHSIAPGKALDPDPVSVSEYSDKEKSIVEKYRLFCFTTWWKEVLILLPFSADDEKETYKLELSLHHIAGNAGHIFRMLTDTWYKNDIETNESYNRDDKFFKPETAKTHMRKIIDVLVKFDGKNPQEQQKMSIEITECEKDTECYRKQRNLKCPPKDTSEFDRYDDMDYD